MATITPVRAASAPNVEKIVWETITEADTGGSIRPAGLAPLAGTVQFTGTFNGGTLALEASNDGANWETVVDVAGNDISATAAGMYSFAWPAIDFRIGNNGSGTSEDVDVTLVMRNG